MRVLPTINEFVLVSMIVEIGKRWATYVFPVRKNAVA